MASPPVLIIDTDAERRRALSYGLTAEGYEVVLTVDLDQGQRFAAQLGSPVIVTTLDLAEGNGSLFASLAGGDNGHGRTIVVLGRRWEEEMALPKQVTFLAVGGLEADEVARRIRLVVVGAELGLGTDAELRSLVGDLSLMPMLELLRGLAAARISGRVETSRGRVELIDGEVVAAAVGRVSGLKAFCRLSRFSEGPFYVRIGQVTVSREIEADLDSLTFAAIEDSLGDLPDTRSRLGRVEGAETDAAMSILQYQILEHANHGSTLQHLLDDLPDTDGNILQDVLRLEDLGLICREVVRPTVRIVTDSTCDLPREMAREHGIEIIPLSVRFGDKSYSDGVDLDPRQFYELLTERSHHPQSSPPSITELKSRYRTWIPQGDLVSIHLSRGMSKTYEHARSAAREELAAAGGSSRRLEVIDSQQVSLGLGLLALMAARMATRGESAAVIAQRIKEMSPRVYTLFGVDTLEFLARGGRIGKTKAKIGGFLRFRPILTLAQGEVTSLDQVRGGRAVHPRILELVDERVERDRPLLVSIAHANAPTWADRLRGLIESRYEVDELIMAEVGPVVGTHVGPGCVGVSCFQPTAEEAPLIAPLGPAV